MASAVAPTPVLTAREFKAFCKEVRANENKPVTRTPTPKLDGFLAELRSGKRTV